MFVFCHNVVHSLQTLQIINVCKEKAMLVAISSANLKSAERTGIPFLKRTFTLQKKTRVSGVYNFTLYHSPPQRLFDF